jgi:predicted ArsR family transcriptional regulator
VSKADILVALRNRPMTSSEMARSLGIDRACALRHLRQLETMGRVESQRSARKWVYYRLKG